MKTLNKIKSALLLLMLLGATIAHGQDMSINIISQENSANDGIWAQNAPAGTTTLLVSICNNDGGSTSLAAYRIRPLISFPGAIVQVNASQPGLPPGWTVLTNDGTNIRLSNGTDVIAAGDCRDIVLYVTPIATGGPLTVTGTMAFANGAAPGSTTGPQTPGNNPANDNSTTTIVVTAAVPVKLISFEGKAQDCNAVLTWKTADEINFSRFELEYRTDAGSFAPIGIIPGKQNSTGGDYKFIYGAPSGTGFYRLKQVDVDGSYIYSPIVTVKTKCENRLTVIYPNPAKNEVTISGVQAGETIQLYSIDGHLLANKKAVNAVEKMNISSYPAGTYTIVITNNEVRVMSTKLLKQD